MVLLGIKEAAVWLWVKCPTIIKWYIGAVVVPNILVFSIIFFLFGVGFIDSRVESHTAPMKAARDRQLENMLKDSTHELKLIHTELGRFNRNQDMMMQELLRRSAPTSNNTNP